MAQQGAAGGGPVFEVLSQRQAGGAARLVLGRLQRGVLVQNRLGRLRQLALLRQEHQAQRHYAGAA
eukprot:389494-Pyramimonas_sp.AAC.1